MSVTQSALESDQSLAWSPAARSSDPLAESFWNDQAPPKVLAAQAEQDLYRVRTAWAKSLNHRHGHRHGGRSLRKQFAGKQSPWSWSVPAIADSPELRERLKLLWRGAKSSHGNTRELLSGLTAWLDPRQQYEQGLAHCLEAAAWCSTLAAHGELWESDLAWQALDRLLSLSTRSEHSESGSDILRRQLLGGELALGLAVQFPEIEACRQLGPAGREILSRGLVDLLDGEGLLHADQWNLLRPLLACWTRARASFAANEELAWSAEVEEQYAWLLRQALRLTRRDGSQSLTPTDSGHWEPNLFATALNLVGQQDERDVADLVLPGREKHGKPRLSSSLPAPAVHSEWAQSAVLRPNWSPKSPRVVVTYSGSGCTPLEVTVGRDVLVCGSWDLQLRLNAQRLLPIGQWEQVCWVSDEDVDYLELELPLAGEVRVQRHIVLAREDGFLLLADSILSPTQAPLEYRSTIPIAGEVSSHDEAETREFTLSAKKPRALVMPLGLSEWKADSRAGQFTRSDAGLVLEQRGFGSLFAPVWIDLDRRRFDRSKTWRRLTIGQQRQIQPAHVAAGFRVQLGDQQWLVYRSLAPKANRTLLGHNLSTEFLVGRFSAAGEVRSLLEVE